ncbi:MAG: tetratricopeptide repeat protein [Ignavibacteriae bacterium]|nr:tetratricopeptide repeat protein [Ignavibacteriota bacterium]
MLSQYPNSSLALEGQLWYAKTLEWLRKEDEAQTLATQISNESIENGEEVIAAEAFLLLGRLAERENEPNKAIDYYSQALKYFSDSYLIVRAKAKVGDLYFSLEQYEKANAIYISVYEEAGTEISLDYYGRIQALRGYAALKRYDTAIYFAREMLDDYRFASYHPMIRLEYAGILLAAGYTNDALTEYQFMDTTFARTENGANAAFELAEYYETNQKDYRRAASYYGRAASVQSVLVAPVAKKRENALLRVLTLRGELFLADSLIALSDSARKYPENFRKPIPPGTSLSVADSVLRQADTLAGHAAEQRYVASFTPLNTDSLRAIQARAAYDLGEIYYTELENPDSALTWFEKALDWKVDSVRTPRTLFILAELKQAVRNTSGDEVAQLYRTIVDNYPRSSYAREVGRLQGLQTAQLALELNDYEYAVAESLLWAGDYTNAVEQLKDIIQENPASSIAAKSQYALGWIYEYRLLMPDSALAHYRVLTEKYSTSRYALAVKNKIPDTAEEGERNGQSPEPPKPQQEQIQPDKKRFDDDVRRGKMPAGRGAIPDTLKSRVIEE